MVASPGKNSKSFPDNFQGCCAMAWRVRLSSPSMMAVAPHTQCPSNQNPGISKTVSPRRIGRTMGWIVIRDSSGKSKTRSTSDGQGVIFGKHSAIPRKGMTR